MVEFPETGPEQDCLAASEAPKYIGSSRQFKQGWRLTLAGESFNAKTADR